MAGFQRQTSSGLLLLISAATATILTTSSAPALAGPPPTRDPGGFFDPSDGGWGAGDKGSGGGKNKPGSGGSSRGGGSGGGGSNTGAPRRGGDGGGSHEGGFCSGFGSNCDVNCFEIDGTQCGPGPAAPGAPARATPGELARRAYTFLKPPLPDPQTAPRRRADGKGGLVGLPHWFWMPAEQWQPITQRATDGPIWAEVTATPQKLIIQPGNGMPATECAGPGTPFDFNAPASGQSTNCKVIWQRRGTYNTTVSVVWSAQWAGTGGATGALPDLTVSTTFPVRVAEGQAVN